MTSVTASVDIGGTFTDIIVQTDNKISGFFKVPTTPREPEVGASNGLKKHLGGQELKELVHATTIATNALLGQYGLEIPEIGLLTTRGFRDIIEIGRQNRPSLYDLTFKRPNTIVPRSLRFEISERVDSHGKIITEIDKKELNDIIKDMKNRGLRSVAVSFLNSYLNSSNESEASAAMAEDFPYLSVSSKIAPEQREYERTSTTVVNAALMPIVSRYVKSLESRIKEMGNPGLSIMASSGGLISTNEVYTRPVQIVESGPAAGVIASAEISRMLSVNNVISFDMGGTTAKAGTVVNGEVSITSEYEVGGESHHGRMTKGSGYPVRFPFVDLAEVSAGGGTIIWKDQAGALRIGPISSGADPGPICYNGGGEDPTITDANVALGIVGKHLLGGQMDLNYEGAIQGLSKFGDPFEVAESALNLADLEMARAIRIVTVERGLDPSDFTMMAFGGAGPQHAARIAEELGIRKVIIPPRPGLFSALGLLFSDWRFESRSSFPEDPEMEYQRLEKEMISEHKEAQFLRYADCRYRGQGSELTVPVTSGKREDIEKAFVESHRSTFGFTLDRGIEIVTVRVFAVISRKKPTITVQSEPEGEPESRDAVIKGEKMALTVYKRPRMKQGAPVFGPCAIDDYDSTTFVPKGWNATLGQLGELHLVWGEGQ